MKHIEPVKEPFNRNRYAYHDKIAKYSFQRLCFFIGIVIVSYSFPIHGYSVYKQEALTSSALIGKMFIGHSGHGFVAHFPATKPQVDVGLGDTLVSFSQETLLQLYKVVRIVNDYQACRTVEEEFFPYLDCSLYPTGFLCKQLGSHAMGRDSSEEVVDEWRYHHAMDLVFKYDPSGSCELEVSSLIQEGLCVDSGSFQDDQQLALDSLLKPKNLAVLVCSVNSRYVIYGEIYYTFRIRLNDFTIYRVIKYIPSSHKFLHIADYPIA